ncbi:hypothetical protein ABZS66_38210 [Dactylosporangium sp. NPDC005572]|uniref:hypothetical protein n=1 Tax=Dactylosporangium sp. NPDC005572 TaxID=3156889 RepID=UPI0033ABCD41
MVSTRTPSPPRTVPWWPRALRFGFADLLGPAAILSVIAVICLCATAAGRRGRARWRRPTVARRPRPKMFMLAAGVGITPVRALPEDSPYAPGEAALSYRYTTDQHAIFTTELRQLVAARRIGLHLMPAGAAPTVLAARRLHRHPRRHPDPAAPCLTCSSGTFRLRAARLERLRPQGPAPCRRLR